MLKKCLLLLLLLFIMKMHYLVQFQEPSESCITMFILKMTNGGLRKVKQVALDHTASKWQSRAAKPGSSHYLSVP